MDHGHGSDPAVENLPLSDPLCNSEACLAFYAAENASQAAVPWASQFEYGHWTTWFYLIVIFLFMLAYAFHLWNGRRPASTKPRPSLGNKLAASIRFVSYRRFSGRAADKAGLPSFGIQLIVLAAVIFAAVATFAARPYYRERRGYGSPPLAIRTGLMAIALTPIIFALSGKYNIVSLLTGIGHEKLNVLHRYISYICLALSIVHTIPFLVAPWKEGGAKALHAAYYEPGAFEYTGTPPFGMLVFLSVLSIPWVRAKAYELFVSTHILAALVYLGLMFWHAGNLIDSWAYLWASLALWIASQFGRIFYKSSLFSIRHAWFQGFPAEAELASSDMVRLSVSVPHYYKWRPGQHCFIRIPSVSSFDSHPFTIASAPAISTDSQTEPNTCVFLVRRHTGFTKRFEAHLKGAGWTGNVHLDGPYGSIAWRLETVFDSVVLVAGGGGITSSLSWLLYLAKHMRDGSVAVKDARLIWAVREQHHLLWAEQELVQAKAIAPQGALTYDFYVTSSVDAGTGAVEKDIEKVGSETSSLAEIKALASNGTIRHGRPSLRRCVEENVQAPRTCVLGCGPESMKIDLSNTVAGLQKRILTGQLKEVALHTETFGW